MTRLTKLGNRYECDLISHWKSDIRSEREGERRVRDKVTRGLYMCCYIIGLTELEALELLNDFTALAAKMG